VLKEKSGGEAQTPYYVAIAASFFRFFRKKPDATVRLVVFDEAFDRLDDDRIAKILSFYRDLNLQVIVAVPSEKLESIAPHMDAINLVVRHGPVVARARFFRPSRSSTLILSIARSASRLPQLRRPCPAMPRRMLPQTFPHRRPRFFAGLP
jgi:energy-coupling factor transporter ATP-binding protein EcfA2